ncbi:MAG: amidohydrolase [Planctomycetes bacterium]|nr:amidohydrolase [Planctomycetota bacterium]
MLLSPTPRPSRPAPLARLAPLALALLLLAAGCSEPRSAPPPVPAAAPPATLALVNGVVFGTPSATALLVRGNRIATVGADAEIRAAAAASPGCRLLDACGAHLLPGFHDAHIHLLSGGLAAEQADLSTENTLEGALAALRRFAAAHPADTWVLGRGWQYGIVPPGAFPTRQDLDRAVPDRPVHLESYDGHASWANSQALARAGVTAATPDPEDGRIVREADGRTPAGVLLESATGLVDEHVPGPDAATLRRAARTALRYCLELGITSVDHITHSTDDFALFAELAERGELPIRLSLSPPLDGDLDEYAALRRRHASPFLRFGFLKGFLDGVIESKTAFMLTPYEQDTARGKPNFTPQRLRRLVERAHARGFPVALHAIGDAAVRLALDAFEAAIARHPDLHLRHRIEHIEVVDPADVPRFARLGVIASMQPFHANPFGETPDDGVWSLNLGARRLPMTFAWRALAAAGARLAFGSDWPVMTAAPLQGLAVAMTRRDEQGRPADGWNAHQAVTVDTAVAAYTEGSAYAIGREGELGRLAPGYLADLVVLDPAVRLDQPATLWQGNVRVVVVDGEVRWESAKPSEQVEPER